MVANLMKNKKKQGSIIFLGSIYGVVGQDLNIYKGTGIRENLSYSIIKGISKFYKANGIILWKTQYKSHCICLGGIIDKSTPKIKKFLNNYSRKSSIEKTCKK